MSLCGPRNPLLPQTPASCYDAGVCLTDINSPRSKCNAKNQIPVAIFLLHKYRSTFNQKFDVRKLTAITPFKVIQGHQF